MEEIHEKQKTSLFPKIALGAGGTCFILAFLVFFRSRQLNRQPRQMRILSMKQLIEQGEKMDRTSRSILRPGELWERQLIRRAYKPLLTQMAEDGKISMWHCFRSAEDLASKTENLCRQQEERIRKEGRVVTNREVFEMACGEFDREEANAA